VNCVRRPRRWGGANPDRRAQRPRREDRPRNEPRRVPAITDEHLFGKEAPSIKDLDKAIEGDLEEALSGLSDKDLLGQEQQPKKAATETKAPLKGKVHSIHAADVFVDVPGGRSQGVLPLLQFPEGPPAPGTEVEIHIEGYDESNGLLLLTRKGAAVAVEDWSDLSEGLVVEALVTATNKGGLEVTVNGKRGFMPISQIDLYRVENADQYI